LLPLLNDSLSYIAKVGKTLCVNFNYAGELGHIANLESVLTRCCVDGDNTHLNELGSKYFGRIVADEVIAKVPYLASYIKRDSALSAKITAGQI
jgi:hypothetical protein